MNYKTNRVQLLLILLLGLAFTLFNTGPAAPQSGRISDAGVQAPVNPFSNVDFVFMISDYNGGNNDRVIASTNNLPGPKIAKNLESVSRTMLTSRGFRELFKIYRDAYKGYLKNQENECELNLKKIEDDFRSGRLAQKGANSADSYYRTRLQEARSQKVPPIAFTCDSTATTSFRYNNPLSLMDGNGQKHIIPLHITISKEWIENVSKETFVVIAHETGHLISYLTTGPISPDYREKNPVVEIDNKLKSDRSIIKMVQNGDPYPASHWPNKTTNLVTALEEGFAIYSQFLFSNPGQYPLEITDNYFMETKGIIKILPVPSGGTIMQIVNSDIAKTLDEMMSTEYFAAKLLHRLAISIPDPFMGYRMILQVKSDPEFKKNPVIPNFLYIFGCRYPAEFSKFRVLFEKEFKTALSGNIPPGADPNLKLKLASLISNLSGLLADIEKNCGARTGTPYAVQDKRPIKPLQDEASGVLSAPVKNGGGPVQSQKINEINKSLKQNNITDMN